MLRIQIRPQWQIGPAGDADTPAEPALDSDALLALLAAVQESGSLADAARGLGLSYRHAWGLLQRAQRLFGQALVDAGRGRRCTLTPLASKLLWADRRIGARLSPLLESLASELEGELGRGTSAPRALRLYASHGFAVATLIEQLDALALPVELRYRNSLESVAALARGECDLAGLHIPIGEFGAAAAARYRPLLRAGRHSLVHLAVRRQGLIVAPGNPKRIRGLADLARCEVRFVNRPEGSGTRMLTELLLRRAGLEPRQVNGYEDTEITHSAVAAFIASGMADAGIGVQTAAQRFNLPFIPLLRERYYLGVTTAALAEEPVASAVRALSEPALRARIAALAGYEAAETGRVMTIEEGFG